MLKTGALVGGAVALGAAKASAAESQWEKSYAGDVQRPALAPGLPNKDYTPVITPNLSSLPWKVVDGVKVFHLVAEEVWHNFASGLKAKCWGYNGKVHGPTIEAVEGERIRIYVTNKLKAPTSVHWHGVFLPNGMDGVGGLNQRAIQPGETFKYEWTVRQSGTYMYHSHHDEMTQMGMGMMGMLIFHPRTVSPDYKVDRDFAIMLSEWRIDPGTTTPNPNEMTDFNVLTMNAKCYPGTEPLVVKMGDRVRIRFGNLSAMDHHSIHLHGHYFKITATNGGRIATSAQHPGSTLFVPVGDTQDIEFIASEPGDWAVHCHMTHHVMNQMGHDFPNVVGIQKEGFDQKVRHLLPAYMMMGEHGMGEHGIHVESGHMAVPKNSIPMVGAQGPFDYITMGGMFTLLKVREHLTTYDDPGWYKHPPGTVAEVASTDELRRDLGKTGGS
jgi:FtsP/CotA-like multicopper oxidase with cupredoxin domain